MHSIRFHPAVRSEATRGCPDRGRDLEHFETSAWRKIDEALSRILASGLIDLLDNALPLQPKTPAAVLEKLTDERLCAVLAALDLLAPKRADVRFIAGEPGEHLLGKRALAQSAEALEHQYTMTLPEPTTDLVLLQAATDEACLQYLAVTEALEAALESPRDGTLARRGPHGKRPLGPPTIEDELGPSEGVCVGGGLFPRRTLSKCYLCFRASRAGAISRVGFVERIRQAAASEAHGITR